MGKRKFILIWILIAGVSVFGNENGYLKNYINLIKSNNQKLKALNFEHNSILKSAESEKYLPDPVFTTGIYLQSIETRVGAQKSKFGISQKIPFKGKLKLKMLTKKELAKAVLEKIKQTELDLITSFKKNYYTLSYLNEREKILEQHISLLKDLHSVIMSSYEAGKGNYSSILRIESEIDYLKNSLESVRELKSPVIAKLNELMNRNPEEEIKAISLDEFKILKIGKNEEEKIIKALFSTSPELRSINFKMKAERLNRDLAGKSRYSDFTIGLDWINTSKVNGSSIKDNGKDGLIFKIGMTIPLHRKKYHYQIDASNDRYLKEASEHVNTKNEKATGIKKAFFDYLDGIRKLNLYQNSIIPRAKEALNVLISAYESEAGNYLDVIDAERVLLQFELEVLKSKKDILSAIADIERISGIKDLSNLNNKGGI
ncbi:outer membrane efflux protein [Thermotomaculum hydrothermale]|uniref:Outer membrane efflux protein n=1 Tax=Thermotomaculum hydrothermale TaxID=981385 RepID=A0A7R6PFU2_9BACT|nr:TolC family protein [Thermotomaculum hydrothermale]BBB31794.1 outer membrane efflux protein [Thermotomaculum hydrothermale]